jgi:predicted nucleic acid-binding protein
MPKVFVDTNLLVYSADQHDAARGAKARQVLRELPIDGSTVVLGLPDRGRGRSGAM